MDAPFNQMPRTPIESRFWSKVAVAGAEDCWLWTAARTRAGYGVIGRGGRGNGNMVAHRLSYLLHHGITEDTIDGLDIMHSCDNPPCVNPAHLSVGTRKANVADMYAKGRNVTAPPQGSRHGMSKLNDAQVRSIRAHSGSVTEIMAEFGVSRTQVHRILKRQSWTHI